jgi:hypothetical protein
MSHISKRLVGAAASTLLLTLVSTGVNAQTDVLAIGVNGGPVSASATSTYRFTDSMILNSIGFCTNGSSPYALAYTIKGTTYNLGTDFFAGDLSVADNGIQWLNIAPQSMVNNDTVSVYTLTSRFQVGNPLQPTFIELAETRKVSGVNAGTNITYVGFASSAIGNEIRTSITNSNLRVSPANPGSNVAPEPGTFALALTGGGALMGICMRRRRIAG